MADRALTCFRFRILLGAAAFLVALALPAGFPHPAAAQDLYEARDIPVDETADNEVAAKQTGVEKAKRAAFLEVIRRLTLPAAETVPTEAGMADPNQEQPATAAPDQPPADLTPAPPPVAVPEGDRLEFLIRDVSFQEEKFGGGRYLAKMTVRFQPQEINRYLQRSGVAYLASPSPKTVILPIFRTADGDQLFSDANPWMNAWWSLDQQSAVVPYAMPLGDLADISAIDAARAVAVDPTGINAIAARYQAGAVAIPIAAVDPGGSVLVEVSTFGAGWPSEPELLTFTPDMLLAEAMKKSEAAAEPSTGTDAEQDLPLPEKLKSAAALTLEALKTRWKRNNILRFDEGSETLAVRIPLSGLGDWLALQGALNDIAPVLKWRLMELATQFATVELTYVGDTTRLTQAFARKALLLSPAEKGDIWQLARR